MYLSAVPDLHHVIEDQFPLEDAVVSRATATGTHRREIVGLAPTGKPIRFGMFLQHHIEGGKIAEE
jgi:predicted ester cyclase